MTLALRRFVFTTHVASSVGWVGAVLVFIALAIIGLTSPHEATVRGAYLVRILALILLLAATLLNVYKPFGLTPYGQREFDSSRRDRHS